mmetsp:Transcript_8520/g.14356  ORF Transcript_8520/g.14356 Transcript_8520/m.14356 type:complete len:131 (-) Transcript_8520:891-1283(-)
MEKISRAAFFSNQRLMRTWLTSPMGLTSVQIRNLFIKDANTPNPNCRKFMPGKPVMQDGGTMDFSSIRFTHISPLARQLFAIEGVSRVFYGKDFISVTKKEENDWNILKPEILGAITDNYQMGIPVLIEE